VAARRVPLTAAGMAKAMRGRLVAGSPGVEPTGFGIDSRSIDAGQAFFAIRAARDGHEFVAEAAARGASVVVVSRPVAVGGRSDVVVIEVEDTTRALQDLGRDVRRQSGTTVVAITGSAGKTTTKETAAKFLATKFTVVKNPGNLNNHLGLPLSLMELRHGAEVAVMELGMNHAGEIRVLVGIAEPEVRVWTNVGDAHIGYFGSADRIADAKAEILEGANADSLLVANADDERVMTHARLFRGRTLRFGLSPGADIRAVDVQDLGLAGTRARIETPAGSRPLQVPLLGRGNLANVLCAATVAIDRGVDLDAVVEEAARLSPARHRGEVVTAGEVTIVDDSYNSSPAALLRALDVLATESRARRRVAVLGEMLELGDLSVPLHEASGQAAAHAGLSWLVTVGGRPAAALGRAAVAAGMDAHVVSHFATSEEAAGAVVAALEPGDAVLVKGSRGVKTDVVVDRIAAVFG
jgi:UDP-N-acetylmuramoyl-tripeptide--D-alanyl-D-alanine ligase